MIPYSTVGEFTAALKSITELKEKIEEYDKRISDCEYLLYSKVKSALDYDIVGYENGEAIRLIKSGHIPTEAEILEMRESLNNERDRLIVLKIQCQGKIDNAIITLNKVKNPLRKIVYEKYVQSKTYIQIMNKYSDMFFNEMNVLRYIASGLDEFIKSNE